MKLSDPGRKINEQSKSGKNVSADQDFVRRCKGWEPRDIKIHVHSPQEESYCEKIGGDWFSPGFVDRSGIDWLEPESIRESWTDPATSRPRVDLRKSYNDRLAGPMRSNTDSDSRTMMEQVIDRLLKSEFGPDGFFVICHRSVSCG